MKLKDYIQGKRRGKAANQLEREAMDDPFLHDAMEGFDSVEGNHLQIIEELEKQIEKKSQKKKALYFRYWQTISIAASVLLIIGIGGWLYLHIQDSKPTSVADHFTPKPTQTELYSAEEGKQPKETPVPPTLFTPPVITENIKDSKEIAMNNSDAELKLSVSAMTAIQESKHAEEAAPETKSIANEAMVNDEVQKVIPNASAAAKKSMDKSAEFLDNAKKTTFGEKEFTAYFEKNYDKGICEGMPLSIQMRFDIDTVGIPQNIQVIRSSCDELSAEMLRLLSKSPKWTDTQRKVKLNIKIP